MLVEQFMLRAIRGGLTPEAMNSLQEQFRLPKAKGYRLLTVIVCWRAKQMRKASWKQRL